MQMMLLRTESAGRGQQAPATMSSHTIIERERERKYIIYALSDLAVSRAHDTLVCGS